MIFDLLSSTVLNFSIVAYHVLLLLTITKECDGLLLFARQEEITMASGRRVEFFCPDMQGCMI